MHTWQPTAFCLLNTCMGVGHSRELAEVSVAASQLREGQPHSSELTALLGSSCTSSGTGGGRAFGRVAGSTVVEGHKDVGRSIKQAATAEQ